MLHQAAKIFDEKFDEKVIISLAEKEGPYESTLKKDGYKIYRIAPKIKFSTQNLFVYARLLKSIKPSLCIVHTEGERALLTLVPKLLRIKTSTVIHNVFPYKRFLRLRKIIERKITKINCKNVFSVSKSVLENEKNLLLNKTTQVNNWIDTNHFRPPKRSERLNSRKILNISKKETVFLLVGNSNDAKNFIFLIKNIRLLKLKNFKIFILGKIHNKNIDYITAKRLHLLNHIKFFGQVKNTRRFYWCSDYLVMPSKYEGLSIVSLEACACGLKLFLAKSPGLTDLKKFKINAVYFKLSPQKFIESFNILKNKKFSAQANHSKVIKNFSVNNALQYCK